jgi:The GLUG motif
MARLVKSGQLALALSALSLAACAVEPLDESDIRSSGQALGSSKARVDISSWNGLVGMVSDGNYRLTANLDASGKTWTPKDFRGTFDGNGKTISNLTITGAYAGFFGYVSQAIIRNVKLTAMSVTGTTYAGGLAASALDSQIEQIAVEGTVRAPNGFGAGGIIGSMGGGTLTQSYAKGTVQDALYYAGGLVGYANDGVLGSPIISQSYAQVTVAPNTSDASRRVYAGGIVGLATDASIHDVYAVGNVTGRGAAGGLVGELPCDAAGFVTWSMYRGIYRGDVVDRNAPAGGWAGVVGTAGPCAGRIAHMFYDRTLDTSSNTASNFQQTGATTSQLRTPTVVYEGVYCLSPGTCDDGNFESIMWSAGTSTQHHALRNMPGPNAQPR